MTSLTVFIRPATAATVMYTRIRARSTCSTRSTRKICARSRRAAGARPAARYSRAYIRHLLKAKEMLGMRLCVLHNLYFYNTMMEEIRDALDAGNFASYKEEKLYGMGQINREKEMAK